MFRITEAWDTLRRPILSCNILSLEYCEHLKCVLSVEALASKNDACETRRTVYFQKGGSSSQSLDFFFYKQLKEISLTVKLVNVN